jgi:hypothetical protein
MALGATPTGSIAGPAPADEPAAVAAATTAPRPALTPRVSAATLDDPAPGVSDPAAMPTAAPDDPTTGTGTNPAMAEPAMPTVVMASGRRTHRRRSLTSTERELRRAMLSRFQAAQRAGKAVATAPAGSLTHGSGLGRIGSEEGA